jgi:hypothetical protein
VSQRYQSGRLGSGKLSLLGNKEIEADIAVRLDGKLLDVAQRLTLRRRIRNGSGGNDRGGGTLFAPEHPRQQECADADSHVGYVEGRPTQIAHANVDEINDSSG